MSTCIYTPVCGGCAAQHRYSKGKPNIITAITKIVFANDTVFKCSLSKSFEYDFFYYAKI